MNFGWFCGFESELWTLDWAIYLRELNFEQIDNQQIWAGFVDLNLNFEQIDNQQIWAGYISENWASFESELWTLDWATLNFGLGRVYNLNWAAIWTGQQSLLWTEQSENADSELGIQNSELGARLHPGQRTVYA